MLSVFHLNFLFGVFMFIIKREDDCLWSKHVAIMWPECMYNITVLTHSCVSTEYNTLYKSVVSWLTIFSNILFVMIMLHSSEHSVQFQIVFFCMGILVCVGTSLQKQRSQTQCDWHLLRPLSTSYKFLSPLQAKMFPVFGKYCKLDYHLWKFLLGPEECPAVSLLPRHLESAGANNWKKKNVMLGSSRCLNYPQ